MEVNCLSSSVSYTVGSLRCQDHPVKETIAVCSEIYTKHKLAAWGRSGVLIVQVGGTVCCTGCSEYV